MCWTLIAQLPSETEEMTKSGTVLPNAKYFSIASLKSSTPLFILINQFHWKTSLDQRAIRELCK